MNITMDDSIKRWTAKRTPLQFGIARAAGYKANDCRSRPQPNSGAQSPIAKRHLNVSVREMN